ncbi:sclerostin domain-containing protein 1b [Neoarius graeffei]|uniref:sclerostin domain-containing protein 1b n=1 Tax=Neoarius graeffei TaxID=443677 RepID=UPI00298D5337|nr:sclerostin domain-containing protein 1b [Neoarius graeffei]
MHLNMCGYWLMIFFCALLKSCQGVQNSATELLDGIAAPSLWETHTNGSVNEARSGRRRTESTVQIEQSQLGCRELRSTKYISDGQCTSLKAVKELVCAGECLPTHLLPNWIGGGYWARRDTSEWRCMNEHVRTQRVRLRCRDGSTRTYKVAAVTSCTCKRYTRQHNESKLKPSPQKANSKKRRGANVEEESGV